MHTKFKVENLKGRDVGRHRRDGIIYECVSKSFRTDRLEQELHMVALCQ